MTPTTPLINEKRTKKKCYFSSRLKNSFRSLGGGGGGVKMGWGGRGGNHIYVQLN